MKVCFDESPLETDEDQLLINRSYKFVLLQ